MKVGFLLIPGQFSNQDWYARRGYEVYAYRDKMWSQTDRQGRVWWIAQVRMRKNVEQVIGIERRN
jgi:hypothetical protein